MKKIIIFPLLCLAVVLTVSCGSKEKEAQEFAMKVVRTINSGEKMRVVMMYPDSKSIDSLAVPDTSNVTVAADNDGKTFAVAFGSTASMQLKFGGDGNFTVTESRGLLGIPAEYKGFAYQTGWVDSTLTDVKNAERLKDTAFPAAIDDIVKKGLSDKVTVKGGTSDLPPSAMNATGKLTVSNNSDETVHAGDYKVNAVLDITGYFNMEGQSISDKETQRKKLDGKEIPPHGSVTFTMTTPFNVMNGAGGNTKSSGTIAWNLSEDKVKQMMASYKFTGKEYAEYLKSK